MGPLAFSLPLASSAFCLSCSNAAWVFKYLRGFGQIHFVERWACFTWALASPCLYKVPPPCYLAPEKHSPINREDNYLSHLHFATLEGEHCKLGSPLELRKIRLNWALTGTLISWYFWRSWWSPDTCCAPPSRCRRSLHGRREVPQQLCLSFHNPPGVDKGWLLINKYLVDSWNSNWSSNLHS